MLWFLDNCDLKSLQLLSSHCFSDTGNEKWQFYCHFSCNCHRAETRKCRDLLSVSNASLLRFHLKCMLACTVVAKQNMFLHLNVFTFIVSSY